MRKRILPPAPPSPKKVTPPIPTKVLQEFVGYGDYNLQRVDKCGPKIQGYHCTASWMVVTDDTEKDRFQVVVAEVGNVRRLFHGTPAKNIGAITREGLRVSGSHCMFGKGIYFGEPPKAMGYTSKGHAQQACYLLEAEVALGTALVPAAAGKYSLGRLRAEGYHSVHGQARRTSSWGGTLARDEWVVYSTEQVRLLFVHEFQALAAEFKVPSQKCQVALVPQVLDPRGKRAFLDVLVKPRSCGSDAHTYLKIAGGGLVWVCSRCLEKQHIHVGDKLLVFTGGKVQEVKVKGGRD